MNLDKTWCPFYEDCRDPCDRALTPEVRARAGDMPICQYTQKPPCWFEAYAKDIMRLEVFHYMKIMMNVSFDETLAI